MYRFCVIALLAVLCAAADYHAEFSGKVVLVTGGTSGIGFQTALQFAQNGAKVIVVARDDHPTWFNGSSAIKRINEDPIVVKNNGTARFYQADMSNVTQVKALFKNIDKKEKDLHFAVNAAGIGGPLGPLHTVRKYIGGPHCPLRNNLYATIYSLMYETRYMIKKNHTGAIVNLASVNGVQATPDGSLYGASKFAIVGLSRSVAQAHAVASNETPLIRIHAVAPGLTNTSLSWQQVKYFASNGTQQPWEGKYITPDSEIWKKAAEEWKKNVISHTIAEPKNMADPILYLCSSEASYVTGSVLLVDRGDTA